MFVYCFHPSIHPTNFPFFLEFEFSFFYLFSFSFSFTMEQQHPCHPYPLKELVDSGLLLSVPHKYIRPLPLRPSSLPPHSPQPPLINLSHLHHDRRHLVIREIGLACHTWGFFQVVNHGVPRSTVDSMWAAARGFFELPAVERMQHYSESLFGREVAYITSHMPSKEEFLEWKDSLYFRNPCETEGLQDAPAFCREPVVQYARAAKALTKDIYKAILESLGISSDFSVNGAPEISDTMTAIHYYPPCPDPTLTFGQSAHSDNTLLTILSQDQVGGLQVFRENAWINIIPVPDAFVFNVGDSIEILSNGKYKSVEHRVVVNKEKPRMSIPCFYNPSSDARVGPLETCIDEDNPPLYKEVVLGDYSANALSKGLSGKSNLAFAKF